MSCYPAACVKIAFFDYGSINQNRMSRGFFSQVKTWLGGKAVSGWLATEPGPANRLAWMTASLDEAGPGG